MDRWLDWLRDARDWTGDRLVGTRRWFGDGIGPALGALHERARPLLGWVSENRRGAALSVVAIALVSTYLAFFVEWPHAREITILCRRHQRAGVMVFNLDAEHSIKSIRVAALAPDGAEGDTLWHLERSEDTRPRSTFAYGQNLPGMEQAVPPTPLRDDGTYVLVVETSSGRGRTEFTPAPPGAG